MRAWEFDRPFVALYVIPNSGGTYIGIGDSEEGMEGR